LQLGGCWSVLCDSLVEFDFIFLYEGVDIFDKLSEIVNCSDAFVELPEKADVWRIPREESDEMQEKGAFGQL
jgi:hypothetical protein